MPPLCGTANFAAVWHLDETSTGTSYDSTSNADNCTDGGGQTIVTGEAGNGREYPNVNATYETLSKPVSLSGVSYALEAWFKTPTDGGAGNASMTLFYDTYNTNNYPVIVMDMVTFQPWLMAPYTIAATLLSRVWPVVGTTWLSWPTIPRIRRTSIIDGAHVGSQVAIKRHWYLNVCGL